jgi:peptidoglycan-associated lipoprotein
MKLSIYRFLLASFCLFVAVLLSGCASQKSLIVLLPEDGKVSGKVTVENSRGSQMLDHSWQSVEVTGPQDRPANPVVLEQAAVQEEFGSVMSAMPLPPVRFQLYFKLGSTELLPESRHLLTTIARVVKERHPAQLSIVGHTDTVESADYNYQLGLLRARAVSALLTSRDVAPANIYISSRGKTDLMVKTPDQTLEPRNRRAVVTIQ